MNNQGYGYDDLDYERAEREYQEQMSETDELLHPDPWDGTPDDDDPIWGSSPPPRSTGRVSRYVSCVPAYGRDYQTEEQVRADWEAGKDFLTQDLMVHGYVNKDDKPADVVLNIRYNRLQDICVIDIG